MSSKLDRSGCGSLREIFLAPSVGLVLLIALQVDDILLPLSVSRKSARAKKFTLIRPTARYINVQELRLQEAQEESISHAGRTPRQMEVELTHDLVDSCRPGAYCLSHRHRAGNQQCRGKWFNWQTCFGD